MYIVFQLFSHSHLYEDAVERSNKNSVPQMFKHSDGSSIFGRTPQTDRNNRDLRRMNTNDSQASFSYAQDQSSQIGLGLADVSHPTPPYMGSGYGSRSSDTLAGSSSQEKLSKLFDPSASTIRLVGPEGATASRPYIGACYDESQPKGGNEGGHRVKFYQGSVSSSASSANMKAPKLSWTLTILVLIIVTIVSSRLIIVSSSPVDLRFSPLRSQQTGWSKQWTKSL